MCKFKNKPTLFSMDIDACSSHGNWTKYPIACSISSSQHNSCGRKLPFTVTPINKHTRSVKSGLGPTLPVLDSILLNLLLMQIFLYSTHLCLMSCFYFSQDISILGLSFTINSKSLNGVSFSMISFSYYSVFNRHYRSYQLSWSIWKVQLKNTTLM